MIQIIVQAQKASCRKSSGEKITTGMVGKKVSFAFSEGWDGFVKTAVFEGSGVTKDVVLSGDAAVIPHECLAVPGGMLRVGVYGTDGTVQTPTIYTDIGQIERGADPSGDESAEPTLPIWAQLQTALNEIAGKMLTEEDAEALRAAIRELKSTTEQDVAKLTAAVDEIAGKMLTEEDAAAIRAEIQALEDLTAQDKAELTAAIRELAERVLTAEDIRVVKKKNPVTADMTIADTFAERYCFPLNVYMGDCDGIKIDRIGVKTTPGTTVRFAVYTQGENAMVRSHVLGDAVADAITGIAEIGFTDGYYLKRGEEIFFLAGSPVIPCTNMPGFTVHEYRQYDDRNYMDDQPGAEIPYTIVANAPGRDYPVLALSICDYAKYDVVSLSDYCDNVEKRLDALEESDHDIIFLTQAEYDALSEEEKQAGTYFITDTVQDTDASLSKAGMAADAWAVGDRLGKLGTELERAKKSASDAAEQAGAASETANAAYQKAEAAIAAKMDSYTIKTVMDSVATPHTQYYLGNQTAVDIVLPDLADVGQIITVCWYNGDTAATLSITGTMLDFDFTPSANTRSEINALWDGTYWAVIGNEMAVVTE